MHTLDNAKITLKYTYTLHISGIDGIAGYSKIQMYEISKDNIYEYWYGLQDYSTLHFAVGGLEPIEDKEVLKRYIDKDLLEMEV